MSPRTGRPLTENGKKDKLLQVRLDRPTFDQLDDCVRQTGLNRSEIVREGIKLVSEKLDKKK